MTIILSVVVFTFSLLLICLLPFTEKAPASFGLKIHRTNNPSRQQLLRRMHLELMQHIYILYSNCEKTFTYSTTATYIATIIKN